MKTRKRLGDMLVEEGLVTKEEIEKVLKDKKQTQRLGEALVHFGLISETSLFQVLKKQLGISNVRLKDISFDERAINLIPQKVAERYRLIPLTIDGNILKVAMVDPLDFYAIEDLQLMTGFRIESYIAMADDISSAIGRLYGMDPKLQELAQKTTNKEKKDEKDLIQDDSPIIKLVNQIIANGVNQRASDIHIDPRELDILIRYRIDGVLYKDTVLPVGLINMLTARIKILGNLDITESRLPQDGRMKMDIGQIKVDLRISTLPTVYGEKIVIRVLDISNTTYELENAGFTKENYQEFYRLMSRPNGMILITGPTGSGKTTTLYSALGKLNTDEVNIITIEDPVEYRLDGINQIQINTSIQLTFARGLRAILRQDPNIIMVGEIRDRETAEIAIRSSLTGHLVFSTLHTNDAIGVIARLIDMGVEPYLIAASLNGVLAQRLVRKICIDCKEPYIPNSFERHLLEKEGIKVANLYHGKGCPSCNNTGFKGRVAIHELLTIHEEMRDLILDNQEMNHILEVARKKGMTTLYQDGLIKCTKGLTTIKEILKVACIEQVAEE